MAPRDPRVLLTDIIVACDRVAEFVADADASSFAENMLLRSAVERQITIAGEAVVQFRKHHPEEANEITDVTEIIAFRNLAIHAYHIIVAVRVWLIVERHVPVLRADAQRILDRFDPNPENAP